MISWIIKTEAWVICRSRRLRRITQTRGLIIDDVMPKPNSIIVLLYIFFNYLQMKKLLSEFANVWEHYTDIELDMINTISSAVDIALAMSPPSTYHCILLYIQLTVSFLIGRKRTLNFLNRCLGRHLAANYTIIMLRSLKVRGIHIIYSHGVRFLRVNMSNSRALCCLPSVKKQEHDFQVYFVDRGRHRKNSWMSLFVTVMSR